MEQHKVCTTCNKSKTLSDFHKANNGLYKRAAKCKLCRGKQAVIFKQTHNKNYKTLVRLYRSETQQQCGTCRLIKLLAEFSGNKVICRGCVAEYDREYRKNHGGVSEARLLWNRKNKDRLRIIKERYASKEEARLKKKVNTANRRANLASADGTLTLDIIRLVFKTYGKVCLSCLSEEKVQIDHVVPLSLGGTNLFENLQPLCSFCNTSKGNRSSADYRLNNPLILL